MTSRVIRNPLNEPIGSPGTAPETPDNRLGAGGLSHNLMLVGRPGHLGPALVCQWVERGPTGKSGGDLWDGLKGGGRRVEECYNTVATGTLDMSSVSKPIALYARVSTADQRLESQLEGLHRYGRDRGAEVVEFLDHGASGATTQRPALDEMMAEVRRRRFGAVVVTKLDQRPIA